MKVLIGITSFNDLDYLKEVLPCVAEVAENLPADVVLLNNGHNKEIEHFVKKNFPQFQLMRHKSLNIGYGRAFSEILRANPGYDYYLVWTNDVVLDFHVVKKFVKRMEHDKNIAMCAGKLHHWDFENHRKTNVIDSLGIEASPRHHFVDRGHGEVDSGQYDDVLGDIFGISGAVFLIRTAVVPKLHGETWRLFDERMWMYKEDIDLAYRLRELDEGVEIFPEVWGWHARTASSRKAKPGYVRLHSYKNHLLLLKNHLRFGFGPVVLARVIFYEILKGTYMLLRYPRVFFAGMKTLFFAKGRRGARLVSAKKLLSYFK